MQKTAVKDKYIEKIINILEDFSKSRDLECFIFGSSLKRGGFGDVDVGIKGNVSHKNIVDLKNKFEESSIPYFVDVVDFNKVSREFRDNVFNNTEVLWIKR